MSNHWTNVKVYEASASEKTVSLSREIVKDREACHAAVHGVAESQTW